MRIGIFGRLLMDKHILSRDWKTQILFEKKNRGIFWEIKIFRLSCANVSALIAGSRARHCYSSPVFVCYLTWATGMIMQNEFETLQYIFTMKRWKWNAELLAFDDFGLVRGKFEWVRINVLTKRDDEGFLLVFRIIISPIRDYEIWYYYILTSDMDKISVYWCTIRIHWMRDDRPQTTPNTRFV